MIYEILLLFEFLLIICFTSTINNMITKLLRTGFISSFFATAPTKRIGRQIVPELPNITYPIKAKPVEDERLSTNFAYQTLNYLKKDRLPNCKYFAVEYENRIYHFYNAYYYPLGRMMNRISQEIRGKNSPHYKTYRSDVKNGDVCVIVNIEDPLITGKKILIKKLRYHTGFVGHLREYSYSHVLNHKPQLLYHHLLRKVMPKNKLSVQYMANVILCRGPTHNLSKFPQFAPNKKVYEHLPDVNFKEMISNDPDIRFIEQSSPGLASQFAGRKVQKYLSERDQEQQRRELDENIEDLSQIHQDVPKFKYTPNMTKKQYDVLKNKEKRIEERYRVVRAPYKKKDSNPKGMKMFLNEKKARKDPNYQLLKNEDLQQVDEEFSGPNPHKIGGGSAPPKPPRTI